MSAVDSGSGQADPNEARVMESESVAAPMSASERYARAAMVVFPCLSVFIVALVMTSGQWFPFVAMVATVASSFLFRRRFLQDQRRRDEAVEDERDREILARSHAGFRAAASLWFLSLALLLAFTPLRDFAMAMPYLQPSLLLLGVVAAQLVENVVVVRLYARERQ